MIQKRKSHDPFAPEHQSWPHQVAVRNHLGNNISVRKIAAGADLRAEFYAELVRMANEGWTLEEPYKGMCFIRRGAERWVVSISAESCST